MNSAALETGTAPAPAFDGIICFGGVDWWYQNRGQYDLQMMRELSKHVPVLYVNSIGMRTPSVREGSMFARRIARKLRSFRRGLVEVQPGFHVYSPLAVPGAKASARAAKFSLAFQVRTATRRCGIRRPLAWVACPPAVNVLDDLDPVVTVYQRTDRFEQYHGVDFEQISEFDRQLKERADLVLFCAQELYESEKRACRQAAFIDHGVDFDHFAAAAVAQQESGTEPDDMQAIARPRIGFIGGIDAHTLHADLFLGVAGQLPDLQFVMVGACSLPDGWCTLPNVHFLGQRPYELVAAYMAACDVLIMPWNQNDWIKACNPVKLKEYLAVGKSIVSTPFPEIAFYRDHVDVADNADAFAALIRQRLAVPAEVAAQRTRVQAHDWTSKAMQAWEIVNTMQGDSSGR
jgi:glycosyltransferase involved in cell wall biosynthesis